MVLLFVYGIPLLGRMASFVSGLKGSNTAITSKDKTPPAPPTFNTFPDFTNQENINISGFAESGTSVKLTLNGSVTDVLVDKDGNFSFQNLKLDSGDNNFSAVAIDTAGNISQITPNKVINLDTKAPEFTIDSPNDGSKFYGTTQRQINIQGTTEAGVNITINDRLVSVDSNGKFQYPVTLNGGDNNFNIKVTDPAGNLTEKNISLNFSE